MSENVPARCTIPGCEGRVYCRCLCKNHYRAQRAADRQTHSALHCTVDGCETPSFARGLCETHYQRKRRARLHPPCREGRPHRWSVAGRCLTCGIERMY